MIFERMEHNPGTRFLFVAAMLVVVLYGLKYFQPILLPFSLALFLAVLSLPITTYLQKRGWPNILAILVSVLVDAAVVGLMILLASQSLSEFQERIPRYRTSLTNLWDSWIEKLQSWDIPAGEYLTTDIIDPAAVFDLLGGTFQTAVSVASQAFLVFLIMFFMLAEATVFPVKFRAVLGKEMGHSSRLNKIVREVQEYLGIKTVISLATGILLGVWAWFMGLDFPVLLGLVAFVLNYIPTIGSLLAAIPALLLALIQFGVGPALLVSIGYIVVNTVFGNIIEPNLLGRRLGLSTLVVILSLVFWGWLWGPVGALLAMPLTMVAKIMLENTPDLRWVAIMLDKAPPERIAASKPPEVAETPPT